MAMALERPALAAAVILFFRSVFGTGGVVLGRWAKVRHFALRLFIRRHPDPPKIIPKISNMVVRPEHD